MITPDDGSLLTEKGKRVDYSKILGLLWVDNITYWIITREIDLKENRATKCYIVSKLTTLY